MKPELIQQIAIVLVYITIQVYYSLVYRKWLRRDREIYKRVFEGTLETFAHRYVRNLQRTQMLQVFDWAYARRTHGDLLGLAYILPGEVMESEEPIDITKYFTDEEAEAIIEGLEVFSKDKRTAKFCDHFVVRG